MTFQPVARGRGGNYRSFLRILVERAPGSELDAAVDAVVDAEYALRRLASPPRDGIVEPGRDDLVARFHEHLARVRSTAGIPAAG